MPSSSLSFIIHVIVQDDNENVPLISLISWGEEISISPSLRGPHALKVSRKTYGKSNLFLDRIEHVTDTPHPHTQDIKQTNSFLLVGIFKNMNNDRMIGVSWFHNCVVHGTPSTMYCFRTVTFLLCKMESKLHSFTAQLAVRRSNSINIMILGDLVTKTNPNFSRGSQ
jgi:hypothetical protein